jgi:hypothetical protein
MTTRLLPVPRRPGSQGRAGIQPALTPAAMLGASASAGALSGAGIVTAS